MQVCGFWSTCRYSCPCKKREKESGLSCKYLPLQLLVIIEVRPWSTGEGGGGSLPLERVDPRIVLGGCMWVHFLLDLQLSPESEQ